MIRSALILALLVPLTSVYHAQYIPAGPHFPVGTVLNPCLISAWPMNEGSGITLHDTSPGGTNTATVNNISNITWGSNAGFPGSSIGWGTAGFATATSTTLTNFSGTTPFSVSAWTSGASGSQLYATNISSNSNHQGWLLLHHLIGIGNDLLEFQLTGTSGGNAIVVRGSTNYAAGGTDYVVATYDGSQTAAGVKLYFNGVLETPTVVTNTLSTSTTTGLAPTFNNTRAADLTDSPQLLGYVEVYNCVVTSGFISSSFASGPGIY